MVTRWPPNPAGRVSGEISAVAYQVSEDGSLRRLGEITEMTWRGADGSPAAGACPLCSRQPMGDTPVICEHGVAVKGVVP